MILCYVKKEKIQRFKFRHKPMTVEELKADPFFNAMLEFRKKMRAAYKEMKDDDISKYADT